MNTKFTEYKNFDLSQVNKEILDIWNTNKIFEKSVSLREGHPPYVFFEGPPSANGRPGIHHVIARAIKDIICRYKTLKGFHVRRKAGWDTHGLPVELGVEKSLGITKIDIGTKISVEDYNAKCRSDVMQFTDVWVDLTHKMGYWVNMDEPYITYENKYIETLWYLLKKLYDKGFLYKGYSIQPYSPAAGTGLSTHELNQPGCYKDVKDTTCIAQFKVVKDKKSDFLFSKGMQPLEVADIYFLAWTTTPWTLLSNTALAVGKGIKYLRIQTYNQYTGKSVVLIIAKDLYRKYFPKENENLHLEDYITGNKKLPFKILAEYKGLEFEGINYEQLLPYQQPTDGDAFKVVVADFVTTEDGTGIVHLAPSFGADDFRVAKQKGIGSLTMVDKQGRFTEAAGEFAGKYVKNAYDPTLTEKDPTADVLIAIKLKKENKVFKVEKHTHSYPHCWRTDKPVLYYPLDSWFIKTTAVRDRMIELNKTINWKPKSTGSGRFGKWLENLVDWNLSRSRYWGTPLPIWCTLNRQEKICIGSVSELKEEIAKSIEAGFMEKNPFENFDESNIAKADYKSFDLHRPYVDDIILVSSTGEKMLREPDLIDVWFDSGAMPYAQLHYPFENEQDLANFFPADFIAEGVDQTRGWFFTLHAISVMLFDSVSFKNIISTGLVLDKSGQKMSKRLDNMTEPFEVIDKYGADPLRWYMITNAPPWDNLKFDITGVDETKRKFFGTLYNTYSFFALYANVDKFKYTEETIPVEKRPEIDRWIMSLLNSLIKDVESYYEDYELTKAGRAIQDFVIENLSNWYVRLNRKRFWGGEYSENKIAAYQTLYTCLSVVSKLASPIAPFYMDRIYLDLNKASGKEKAASVHLTNFPSFDNKLIDTELEEKMHLSQQISSMVLSLRRKVRIKVRQPLSKIMIPLLKEGLDEKINSVKNIILTEVNIKNIEFISDTSGILIKKIKANFKTLGPKYGKLMKKIASSISKFSNEDILEFEKTKEYKLNIDDKEVILSLDDVEILSEDIPGWLIANEGNLTVALDINITEELREEGIARELINRIQNLRKDNGFEVIDKINIEIQNHEAINSAINAHKEYISAQTLALSIDIVDELNATDSNTKQIEIDTEIKTYIKVTKI